MADKKKGYVPIYRAIQDNWLWKTEEPFDVRSAWIDLLLLVNHKEGKINIKGRVQRIQPGQKWTSYRTLATRWNWSVGRVRRYIKLLKSDGMIYTDETPNGTLLTIMNWGDFTIQQNADRHTDRHTDEHASEHTDGHTGGHITIMNNNVNNVKNVNKKDPAVCPGKGWIWNDESKRWIAPPKEGGAWQ